MSKKQHRDPRTGERVWELELPSGATWIGTERVLKERANTMVDEGKPEGGFALRALECHEYSPAGFFLKRHYFSSQRPKR